MGAAAGTDARKEINSGPKVASAAQAAKHPKKLTYNLNSLWPGKK
jgi:hypothetical protein